MKRLLILLLRVALAAALLSWVAGRIEWGDQLQLPAVAGGGLVDGRLEGDWQGGGWTFAAADGRAWAPPHVEGLRPRPGFPKLLVAMDVRWYLLGCAAWAGLVVLSALRWQLLLRAVEVPSSYFRALRLVLAGNFFNNVMFGATGGDLARAVLVTRGLAERRWRAALSVGVDRVVGLLTLLAIAAVALVLARYDERLGQLRVLKLVSLVVGGMLFGILVTASLYFNRPLRELLSGGGARRPPVFLQRADEALLIYRNHRRTLLSAVVVSLPLQFAGIFAFYSFGKALGSPLQALDTVLVFPSVQAACAVPVAPAGWGLGESLYGWFHARILRGSEWFTLGVAVSVLFRLTTQVGFGLVGGAVWLFSRDGKAVGHPS